MRPGKVWHLAKVAIDRPHYRRDKLMPIASKGREALDRVQQQQVDRANQLGENHALFCFVQNLGTGSPKVTLMELEPLLYLVKAWLSKF